jgi:hypothetical protein
MKQATVLPMPATSNPIDAAQVDVWKWGHKQVPFSPLLRPAFPYSEPKKARKRSAHRLLTQLSTNPTMEEAQPNAETPRPSLAAAKYQTEISKATAQRAAPFHEAQIIYKRASIDTAKACPRDH